MGPKTPSATPSSPGSATQHGSGWDTGTSEGGTLASALETEKKIKKKINSPPHHPRTMGPLIKIKSAVEQVVPERRSGSPVGPGGWEGSCPQSPGCLPNPRALPKILPSSRVGSRARLQGHLQPQAGDRDVLCCPRRNWGCVGPRAVPDRPAQPGLSKKWDLGSLHQPELQQAPRWVFRGC